MQVLRNERGMTLIEVLATVVILSIVTITLSKILVDGVNISNKHTTNMTMQQQANQLLVFWRELHEYGNEYEIIVSDDKTEITLNQFDTDGTTVLKTEVITSSLYFFELFVDSEDAIINEKINPTQGGAATAIDIKISIIEQKNVNKHYDIQTTLSRL